MDWILVLTVFFGLATIISILVAIRLARRKKPVWAYVTKKIIGLGTDAPPELKLSFNNMPVKDVCRTLAIVFNRGNQAIRREDVREKIAIRLPGAQILRDPYVTTPSKTQIQLSANREGDDAVVLDFDFLDHKDGAVVEILHTACADIKCTGYILEAGEPRYIGEFIPYKFQWTMRKIIAFGLSIIFAPFYVVVFLLAIPNGIESFSGVYFGLLVASSIAALGWQFIADLLKNVKFPAWSKRNDNEVSVLMGIPLNGRCVNCGAEIRFRDARLLKTKKGRLGVQGVCPDCGTKYSHIDPE